MDVLIDTSVYQKDPTRKKAAFRAIERLARVGELRIHVPSVVRSELAGQAKDYFSERVRNVEAAIRDLGRRFAADRVQDQLATLSAALDDLKAMETAVVDELFDWFDTISAKIHEPNDSHSARVLDRYFEGALPFNGVRDREGFPDAFIAATAEDIAATLEGLHVIAADARLLEACKAIANVETHEDLESLIALPEISAILRDTAAWEAKVGFLERFQSDTRFALLKSEPQLVEALFGESVYDEEGPTAVRIGDITGVVELNRMVIDIPSAVDYGGELVWVPFLADVVADVEVEILKSEYYVLPDAVAARLRVVDLNERYFSYENEHTLAVRGNLLLVLKGFEDASVDPASIDLDAILQTLEVLVDAIESVTISDGADHGEDA